MDYYSKVIGLLFLRRQERKSLSKYIMVTWVSKSAFSEQKQLYIGLDVMMN